MSNYEIYEGKIEHFEWHPSLKNVALYISHNFEDKMNELYFTLDLLKWEKVLDKVEQSHWGSPKSSHYDPYTIYGIQRVKEIFSPEDIYYLFKFNTKTKSVIYSLKHAREFFFTDQFMLVATVCIIYIFKILTIIVERFTNFSSSFI